MFCESYSLFGWSDMVKNEEEVMFGLWIRRGMLKIVSYNFGEDELSSYTIFMGKLHWFYYMKGMWLLLLPVWFFASKKRKEEEEQRGSPMANSQSSFLDEIKRILFTSSQESLTPLCTDPTMIMIHDYLSIHPSIPEEGPH